MERFAEGRSIRWDLSRNSSGDGNAYDKQKKEWEDRKTWQGILSSDCIDWRLDTINSSISNLFSNFFWDRIFASQAVWYWLVLQGIQEGLSNSGPVGRNYPCNTTNASTGNYRKSLNCWTVCYVVRNSPLWKVGHSKNTAQFSPSRTEKKVKLPDLTEKGNPNDIAHGSIIQVFTVGQIPAC